MLWWKEQQEENIFILTFQNQRHGRGSSLFWYQDTKSRCYDSETLWAGEVWRAFRIGALPHCLHRYTSDRTFHLKRSPRLKETEIWFHSWSSNTLQAEMQFHPTRGWSGHLHVTAEVCGQSPFRKPVSPLFRLSNIKVFLFWVFPSASCPIINVEPTLSFKQINTLHLLLKIWHSTNISMLWSLLPMLQLYIHMKQQSEVHC